VGIWVIGLANLPQRCLEEIPDGDALADVEIAKGVDVHASRLPKVFVGAFRELLRWQSLHPPC
jgi:hypothetical protein